VTISNDDRKAFAAATADVRPLKRNNLAELELDRPTPRAHQSRAARVAVLEESLTGPDGDEASADVGFRRKRLGTKAFRKLRRGEYAIEAEIDLHGMRLDEAKQALKQFLSKCVSSRLACVRVIHGKGTRSGPEGPVLKPSVHLWLSRWDAVLAFASAQSRHGGSGAVYVLLIH
jgi:DNA-nicking Smr family endonuclease